MLRKQQPSKLVSCAESFGYHIGSTHVLAYRDGRVTGRENSGSDDRLPHFMIGELSFEVTKLCL